MDRKLYKVVRRMLDMNRGNSLLTKLIPMDVEEASLAPIVISNDTQMERRVELGEETDFECY